jgi:hypothetical protein
MNTLSTQVHRIVFFLVGATIALCIVFILSSQVQAATQQTPTYSCSVPVSRLDWDTRENDTIQPCMVQKFDTALGSLTQINITLTQMSQGEFGIENTTSQAQSATAIATTRVQFLNPDNSVLQELQTRQSSSVNLDAYDNTIDFSGGSGTTIPFETQSQTQMLTLTDQPSLDIYSNTIPGLVETISFEVSGISILEPSGDIRDDFEEFVALDARASADVIYTYEVTDTDSQQSDTATELLRSGGASPSSIAYIFGVLVLGGIGITLSLSKE